ncbi:NADH dehydrogenase, alpha subcomplex, subunit 6 [Meredithblackwellia eburnea MCA 4105]
MTTIPSRLARVTASSGSWPVAQARSRALYRLWYRAAPEIVQLYAVNFPASAIRAKVRQEYERNRLVDDLETVDVLLLKGFQDYQETVNCWKMESQLMRWFSKEELPARPDTFLESFYASRDDGKEVQPTA